MTEEKLETEIKSLMRTLYSSISEKLKCYEFLFQNELSFKENNIVAPFFDEIKLVIKSLIINNIVSFDRIKDEYVIDDDIQSESEYLKWIDEMNYDDVGFNTFEIEVLYTFYSVFEEVYDVHHFEFDTIDSNLWEIIKKDK